MSPAQLFILAAAVGSTVNLVAFASNAAAGFQGRPITPMVRAIAAITDVGWLAWGAYLLASSWS